MVGSLVRAGQKVIVSPQSVTLLVDLYPGQCFSEQVCGGRGNEYLGDGGICTWDGPFTIGPCFPGDLLKM